MIHTKVQAAKPSGSEEEDFFNIFYVFLWFEHKIPGEGLSCILGPSFEQNWLLGNATEFQASELSGTKEEDF